MNLWFVVRWGLRNNFRQLLFHLHTSATVPVLPGKASQNRDPASASIAPTSKGVEPSGGTAWGPVGKRLH